MRSNLSATLALALLTGLSAGVVRAQAPAKPLSQDELLKQIESLSPASTDPGRGVTTRNPRPNPAAVNALFPEKKEPRPDKPQKKSKGPTEIVALEGTFDQKEHIAVFIGDVVVTDPEFTVQADKLTAYLKNDEKPAEGAAPKPAAAKEGGAGKGGLERAVAEADPGKMVTVTQEKQELDGSISRSIGHGRKVLYDSITGDITLVGRPDVQQGINSCVATDDGTVMVLNRDGKMRVTGAHRTVIKEDVNKK